MKLPDYPKWCPHIRKDSGNTIHVYDPIFKANFYFFLGQTFKRYRANYKSIFGIYPEAAGGVSGFFSVETVKDTDIGCIYSDDKGSTLMHECLHATIWILRKRGININMDTDEVATYYQEFLVKWATKK